jgi:hypothetical protein
MTCHLSIFPVHFDNKTMNLAELSSAATPRTGDVWRNLSDSVRRERVRSAIATDKRFSDYLEAVEARDDGEVILRFVQPASAGIRGPLLLDFEEKIKSNLDQGLNVWLEPLGDRSSLRRLRGIQVKS